MEALQQDQKYTYTDYIALSDDVRYELIDGVFYLLASPSETHQRVSMEIARQLANFLVGKNCAVYTAPFDVRLHADADDDTVVVPDIVVVCDRAKLADGKACKGAPDMIIEILSPSTALMDKWRKFNQYLQAGVREYWIVDTVDQFVNVNVFKNGEYINRVYCQTDQIAVDVLDGCIIDLSIVF